MAEPTELNSGIQEVIDTRADMQSFNDFINAAKDVIIARRLALPANSLDYYLNYLDAIKLVFTQANGDVTVGDKTVRSLSQLMLDAALTLERTGGNIPYLTYAAMVADKANITTKMILEVTNDTDQTKNGKYTYDGVSVFTKSNYDVLAQAKVDATSKTLALRDEIYTNASEINYTQTAFKNVGARKVDGSIAVTGLEDWRHTDKIKVRKGDSVEVTTIIAITGGSWLAIFNSSGIFSSTLTTPLGSSSLQVFTHKFLEDGFFSTQHSPLGTSGCSIKHILKTSFATRTELANRITPTKNIEGYLPATTLIDLAAVDNANYINHADGAIVSNSSFPHIKSSGYIAVKPLTDYWANNNDVGSWIAEYDANKVFVKGHAGRLVSKIKTTASTRFVQVNINTNAMPIDGFIFYEGAVAPTGALRRGDSFEWLDKGIAAAISDLDVGLPYSDARFKGKKLLVTGDSITDSANAHTTTWWHGFVRSWLQMQSVQNDGKSGSGIIKTGSTVGINYRLASWATSYTSSDLIMIMGNMNDGTSGATGAWDWIYGLGDAHKNDWTTVVTTENMADSLWYALRYMFEELLRQYPNTPIGFITSTPRSQVASKSGTARTGYSAKCWGQDGWFAEWVDAIKLVAGHYSIPVLDLYHQSNLRPWIAANNTEFFSGADGIHPNLKGHELMAQKILEFTKQYC